MAAQPKHRQLPDKETKLFKELLTQYELKQYKKGIKAADTILKKFPNHGETIALKALTMHSSLPYPPTVSSIAKLPEIEEMARLAVKKDMMSHITWHVLGIMAKNRKDYTEASRAFTQARKIDPDNLPLLRDSMSLYLHTRQFGPAVQVRQHFLTLRPQIRSSWIGLIVAHHLNGDIPAALEVYEAFQSCVNVEGGTAPEQAQTALYIIRLCIEQGNHEDALKRLEKGLELKIISARGEISHMKADLLFQSGRTTEAKDAFLELLKQNPDNHAYYRGLLKTEGLDITTDLSDEQRATVLAKLNELRETYPKSSAPRRLSLEVAQGEKFRQLAWEYLVVGLEKGIPSLFVDVKGLYRDASKMKAVGEIVEELVASLEKEKLRDDDSIPPPTTLLWAYYFLALHISHPSHTSTDYARSLELLSTALKHTPTLPEIHMARAKVLKRAGDPQGAAHSMEEARLLDLQDRFLNGKAAKYWLRAGHVTRAEDLLALFTKKDMTAPTDLTEMQCLWFLQEDGDCHRRNGDLGMALKRYQALATTFRDYDDDHYDFHQYCLRRMTLSAYIDLMRYEDQLYSHPAYFKGALSAIEIYTRIFDKPGLTEKVITAEDEAERKRAAKKAQKAEQKAKKAAAATSDGKKEDPPAPDDDPDGSKLVKTETPLDDALKLWKPLHNLAKTRIETWTAGYEIYIRKGMYLEALKCLNEAADIDRDSPVLHRQIINFNRTTSTGELNPAVKATIEKVFDFIPASTTPAELNSSFLSSHSTSAPHILACAEAAIDLQPTASAEQVELILSSLTQSNVTASVEQLTSAIEVLERAGATNDQVDGYKAKCRSKLPLAWVFASDEEKASRKLEQGVDGVAVDGEKTDV